LKSLNKH